MIKRMLLFIAWILLIYDVFYGNAGQDWIMHGSLFVLTILGMISLFGLVKGCGPYEVSLK
jgi:hypothetical protein